MARPTKKNELEKCLENLPIEKRKGRQKLTGAVSFDFDRETFYVYLGVVDGKKKYKSFKTAKETERFIKEKEALELKSGKSMANIADITLRQYMEKYHRYRKYVTNTTRIFYSVIVNRIEKYSIVDIPMNDITGDMLNEFFLEHEMKYAPSTVSKDYSFLKAVFSKAYKEGVVAVNRMDSVEAIYAPKPDPKTYSEEQLNMIIKFCLDNFYKKNPIKGETKHNYCTRTALIASLTGCRREEILGLKFKHIHLDAPVPYMEIVEARSNVKENENNLKTDSSARKVPICSTLIEFFKKLKEEYEHNRELLGNEFNDTDYVICFENGNPVSVGTVANRYKKEMKGCGISEADLCGYHIYRATVASTLRNKNAHSFAIQNLLGHASLSTTERYYFDKDKPIPDVPLEELYKKPTI